jgi:group I intron endonuclease
MQIYNYITTNSVNGKQYIGVHCTDNINDGYIGSGLCLLRAIKKYGKRNFIKEILAYCDSEMEGHRNEEKYIKEFNTLFPNGYNLSPTGGIKYGGKMGETTKHKLKIIALERGCKPPPNSFAGYKHSEESKLKISTANSGKVSAFKNKSHTEEAKEKNRLAHIGRQVSEETRKKLSEAHIESWEKRRKAGTDKRTYKLSDKQRQNLSNALKGKKKPPRSEEHIKNLTKAITGRKLSLEHRKNLSQALRGKKKPPRTKEHQEKLTLSIRLTKKIKTA